MKRGFTLIEMLVSVALFSVVMVLALGALLSLSTADRKAQALKSAIDNLNFALDSMSRTIRTGSNYHCGSALGGNCTSGNNTFYFTANNGVVTAYRLESLTIDSNAASVCGQTIATPGCLAISLDGGATWAPVTSPNVIINDLSASNSYLFHLWGSAQGSIDNTQPIVVMTLSGYVQVSTTQQSAFHLQTTVTQRIYDQ
ncbi:MAG TPA: type II secretion system protein [Candidatus Paceibacterota bacterium]|nr:type II secretion system protein [Candidatus Paceibacterota bacterium]